MMMGVDPDHVSGVGAFSGNRPARRRSAHSAPRDLRLHERRVLLDFGGAARAGNDGDHGRVRRAELQRRRLDVGAVAFAEGADGVGARHHVGLRRFIVERRAAGQKPGIVGAAQHDLDALGEASGEQLSERGVVEQGVAPGDQEEVRLGRLEAGEGRLHQIEPHAPGVNFAAIAQGGQHSRRAGHGFGEALLPRRAMPVLRAVVDVDDVETAEPRALMAVLQRADRAGGGVVEGATEGQGVEEALVHGLPVPRSLQQPADLGGECIRIARAAAQRVAQPVLRQPCAVVRRGIVVTDAGVPGGLQAGDGGLLRHDRAEIAQRRRAEAERARRSVAGHAVPLTR